MDSDRRRELIDIIKSIGLPEDIEQTPVVTLEQFFDGNDDVGSIGCNLSDHPGVAHFYNLLREIRSRGEVSDVVVGIYEVEEADEDMWPFAEQVFVATSASAEDVDMWVTSLEVSEIEPVDADRLRPVPDIPTGYSLFMLWWD